MSSFWTSIHGYAIHISMLENDNVLDIPTIVAVGDCKHDVHDRYESMVPRGVLCDGVDLLPDVPSDLCFISS